MSAEQEKTPATAVPQRSRGWALVVGSFNLVLAMSLASLFAIFLAIFCGLTFFRTRRLAAEFFVRHFARLILSLGRMTFQVYGQRPPADQPVFYMPNHPSIQDAFVFLALGLPNTRFFMSRTILWRFVPIGMIGALIGVFFTPEQHQTAARVRCFQRAYRHLARTRESILGTPEGMVVPGPEVGKFNRGVFHLATLLKYPIQPLYLAFPPGRNAGRGFAPLSPEIGVFFLPRIDTTSWQVEDLERHKAEVREIFCRFGQRVAAVGGVEALAELEAARGAEGVA